MPKADSAFAIIRRRSSILLVKPRLKDRWQLPGGRLATGESPADAVVREVLEETGLRATVVTLAGTHRREDGSRAFVFLVRTRGTTRLAGARHEIAQQEWVPLAAAAGRLTESTRRRLWHALRRYGRAASTSA